MSQLDSYTRQELMVVHVLKTATYPLKAREIAHIMKRTCGQDTFRKQDVNRILYQRLEKDGIVSHQQDRWTLRMEQLSGTDKKTLGISGIEQ